MHAQKNQQQQKKKKKRCKQNVGGLNFITWRMIFLFFFRSGLRPRNSTSVFFGGGNRKIAKIAKLLGLENSVMKQGCGLAF